MSERLKNVCSLPGIQSAAIFDFGDQIIEHRIQPPYEHGLITQICRELSAGLEACAYHGDSRIDLAMAQMADGYLALQMAGAYKILVVGNAKLNPSMLQVAMGILARKLAGSGSQSVSISSSNLSIDMSSARAIENAVPVETMRGLVEAFAKHMGPLARHLLKKELVRLGASSTGLSEEGYSQVIKGLARRIEAAEDRQAFITEAEKLL